MCPAKCRVVSSPSYVTYSYYLIPSKDNLQNDVWGKGKEDPQVTSCHISKPHLSHQNVNKVRSDELKAPGKHNASGYQFITRISLGGSQNLYVGKLPSQHSYMLQVKTESPSCDCYWH
jgi:hypothetical protein